MIVDRVVNAICEGLEPHDDRRDRIRIGVTRIVDLNAMAPKNTAMTLNRALVPIFSRLAFMRHRPDIDTTQYVDSLYRYVTDRMQFDRDGELVISEETKEDHDPAIDREANALVMIAEQFVRDFDQ